MNRSQKQACASTPPRDVSLKERAQTYSALAGLFRWPTHDMAERVVEVASIACEWSGHRNLDSFDMYGSSRKARESCRKADCVERLRNEHARLFGEVEFWALTNIISPCETTYVAECDAEHKAALSAAYQLLDFDPEAAMGSHLCCPGHIAVELEFMAHALARCSEGDERARLMARRFPEDHLLRWAPLFAAALMGRTRDPVFVFAALSLEAFLLSEGRVQSAASSAELTHCG